jgi:hypothetical protein
MDGLWKLFASLPALALYWMDCSRTDVVVSDGRLAQEPGLWQMFASGLSPSRPIEVASLWSVAEAD